MPALPLTHTYSKLLNSFVDVVERWAGLDDVIFVSVDIESDLCSWKGISTRDG